MVITILIVFISLIGLIILHEFGHFVLAKKFGVKVEEFGIGYPPRLIGKKFGETLYSLNLLPFGAFVKIHGEEAGEEVRGFRKKPVWQRVLVLLGGVASFWIIAAILFSIVLSLGTVQVIDDEENHNLIEPKVQIVSIAPDSPAQTAGIKPGDTIIKVKSQKSKVKSISKVKEVQEFTEINKGEEVVLTIQRGKEVFEISLVSRINPPAGEGSMGVGLVRTAIKSYPWWISPIKGGEQTFNLTLAIIEGYGQAISRAIQGQPTGVQPMGPVGIFALFWQVSQLGAIYFLNFLALISIYLALFNVLPIPMVDGGQLLFLVIEKLKGKPINHKIEQNINSIFFALLVVFAIWVTINDIMRLF